MGVRHVAHVHKSPIEVHHRRVGTLQDVHEDLVRGIDRLGVRRADHEERVDDSEVEAGLLLFDELPGGALGQGLRVVVGVARQRGCLVPIVLGQHAPVRLVGDGGHGGGQHDPPYAGGPRRLQGRPRAPHRRVHEVALRIVHVHRVGARHVHHDVDVRMLRERVGARQIGGHQRQPVLRAGHGPQMRGLGLAARVAHGAGDVVAGGEEALDGMGRDEPVRPCDEDAERCDGRGHGRRPAELI